MEHRYHPQIYLAPPKKSRNYIKKDDMLQKKLMYSTKPVQAQQKEKNI
jgi:hypothetical protein